VSFIAAEVSTFSESNSIYGRNTVSAEELPRGKFFLAVGNFFLAVGKKELAGGKKNTAKFFFRLGSLMEGMGQREKAA